MMKKYWILTILVIFLAAGAWGQTNFTWTGLFDNSWDNVDNWFPPGVPADFDTAIFSSASVFGLDIPPDRTVANLVLNDADIGFSPASSGFTVTGAVSGTNSSSVDLNGFSIQVGSLLFFDHAVQFTNGEVHLNPSGSVAFLEGNIQLPHVTFLSGNTDASPQGNLIVTGDMTVDGAVQFNGSTTLTLWGNLTNNGTLSGAVPSDTIHLRLEGGANQTINAGGGVQVDALTVSNPAVATATLSGNLTVLGNVALNVDSTLNGGSATLTVGGNWVNNGGTFNGGTGTVNFNGSGTQTLNPANSTFRSLTRSSGGVLSLVGGGILTVEGDLTNNAGSGGLVGVNGLILTGAADQTINAGGATVGALTVSNSAIATATLSGDLTVLGNVTLTSGTLNGGSATLTVGGDWGGAGTFNGGTGTVNFNGSGTQTLNPANSTFRSLTRSSGGVLSLGNNTLTVRGNLTNNGGLTGVSGLILTDTANQNINAGGATVGALTVNKPSGTATLTGNLAVTGDVTLTSGTLNGGSAILSMGASGISTWGGAGTFQGGTGTVLITGGGTHFLNGTINFEFNNLSRSAAFGPFTMSGAVNVGGDINFSTGNITNAGTLTLTDGTWNRPGGSFTNTGTVNFDNATVNDTTIFGGIVNFIGTGTSTVNANNTFQNQLTATGTVRFAHGTTQTITNFNATGAIITRIDPGGVPPIPDLRRWNIAGLTAANFTTSNTTEISWLESLTNPLNRTAANANDGLNNVNVFTAGAGGTYTWTGNDSSDWSHDGNWSGGAGGHPVDDSTIIIPAVPPTPFSPVLTAPVNLPGAELTINAGATVDFGTHNFSVQTINNSGTIMLHGVAGQVLVNGAPPAGVGGTIHYHSNASAQWVFGNTYSHLVVANTANMATLTGNLTVNNTATLGSDIQTLGTQTYTETVTLTGTGTLILDGSTVTFGAGVTGGGRSLQITGNAEFNGNVTNIATFSVSGTSTINANIATTGNQTFGGAVAVGGAGTRALNAGTATVTLNGGSTAVPLAITGNATFNSGTLTVTGGNVVVSGTATIGGAVDGSLNMQNHNLTAASITVNGTGHLSLMGAGQTVMPSTISGTGTVEFTGVGGDFAGITSFPNLTIATGNGTRTIPAGDHTTVRGNFFKNTGTLVVSIDTTLTFSETAAIGRQVPSGDVDISGGGATSNVDISGIRTLGSNLSITGANLNITGTLDTSLAGRTITLGGGSWNRADTGTFNHNDGLVIFNNGAEVQSSNEFHDITANGTVRFAHNTTQTIGGDFTALGAYLTRIDPLGAQNPDLRRWNIAGLTVGRFITDGATNISWGRSNVFLDRRGSPLPPVLGQTAIDGGNNFWIFAGGTYTWVLGAPNTDWWGTAANWDNGVWPPEPDQEKTIIIQGSATTAIPRLDRDVTARVFTVNAGAAVDLAEHDLEVSSGPLGAGAINNSGTIMLHGTLTQVVTLDGTDVTGAGVAVGANATIHYHNNTNAEWVFGYAYAHLVLANNVTMAPVAGNFTVSDTARLGANVNSGSTFWQTYSGAVTLTGDRTLTGSTVTFGAGGITGGTFSLTITGNAEFNGAVGGGIVNLSVAGTTAINADITTTGTQTYNGNVFLGGVSPRILTGTTVTLGTGTGPGAAWIVGNSTDLTVTVTGNAVLNGSGAAGAANAIGALVVNGTGGNAEFRETTLHAASVDVAGTSAINANITTTTTGPLGQTFTGAVTLGGAAGAERILTVAAGSQVTFTQTITGADRSLRITGPSATPGDVTFNADVTGVANLTVTGHSVVNANIDTSGNQWYDSVALGAATRTFTSSNGWVEATGAVTGTPGVTVHAHAGITMANPFNTLGGIITLNNNQGALGSQSGHVLFNTDVLSTVTVTGTNPAPRSPNSYGDFSVTAQGSIIVGGSGINANGIITLTSTSGAIDQTVGATITASYEALVTADAGITLALSANNVNRLLLRNIDTGDIVFENSRPVGSTLTLSAVNDADAGTITITEHVGSITVGTVGLQSGLAANGPDITNDAIVITAERLTISAGNIVAVSGDARFFLDYLGPLAIGPSATGMSFLAQTTVQSGRTIYISTKTENNLEYGPANTVPGAVWVNSDVTIPNNPLVVLTTRDDANIFIVDATPPSPSQARVRNLRVVNGLPSVTGSGTGFIEIRGIYDSETPSAGSLPTPLVLQPGTGGVRFADGADIIIRNYPFLLTATNANLLLLGIGATNATVRANGITLGGTVNGQTAGNNGLTLDVVDPPLPPAADRRVHVVGEVGGTIRLGDIVVRSNNNTDFDAVTFSAAVTANSYTQTGTGSTLFSGAQDYTGPFSFTGAALTVNNSLTTTNGGSVTIINSGTFTKNDVGDITSNGGFTQSGIGDSIVSANIIVNAAAALSFATALEIAPANGGIITFSTLDGPVTLLNEVSSLGANRGFVINAGAGLVTLGSPAFTGNIIDLSGPFTHIGAAAAGVNVHGNMVTHDADIAIDGAVVLWNSGLIVDSGIDAGHITFYSTVNGAATGYNVTLTAGEGNISFGGIVGGVEAFGNLILINGSPADGEGTVTFAGAVFASTLIFDGGPDQKAQGTSNASLGDVRINDGTVLTLTGDIIQRNDGNLTIGQGVSGVLSTGASGSASGYSWSMGAAAPPPASTFIISNGDLVFNEGSELRSNHFTAPNALPAPPFTIAFNGPALIHASGNVTIGENINIDPGVANGFITTGTDELNIFTLIMRGGTIASPLELSVASSSTIGSLWLEGFSTNVRIVTDIQIRGDVLIPPGTTLQAGAVAADAIHIHVIGYYGPAGTPKADRGARWFQTSGFADTTGPTSGSFTRNSGTVEFGTRRDHPVADPGRTFMIAGNTTWYNFVCHEPLADILFSNFPHAHAVDGWFGVEPQSADGELDDTLLAGARPRMIRISRLTCTADGLPQIPVPDGGLPWIPPPVPNYHFWYLVMGPDALLGLNRVYLNYSWSYRRIPLPVGDQAAFFVVGVPYHSLSPVPNPTLGNPRVTPLLSLMAYSYFNVNWFVLDNFFYSFTEDSTGNGRIDRLRIQAAFDLMGSNDSNNGVRAFEGFDVEVEGFTVDRSRGFNGFERVYEITGDIRDRDSVYIFLNERPYSDSSATPRWRVTRNTSLLDSTTRAIFVGTPAHGWHPTFDTVPPRINYAFTLPEHNEIFFRMSKPVDTSASGITVTSQGALADFGLDRGYELIINLNTPYTLEELAAGDRYFRIENVRDRVPFVPDMRNDPDGDIYRFMLPAPRIPMYWDYSMYVDVTGWFVPGGGSNVHFDTVPPGGTLPHTRDWYTSVNPDPLVGNLMCGQAHGLAAGVYGSGIHRVTDMLISVPPQIITENRYFVWPLWARYHDHPGLVDNVLGWGGNRPQAGYMGPGGSGFNDANIIWDFTGRRFLEVDDIVMQSRLSDAFDPDDVNARLIFAFDVPDGYRSDRTRHGLSGLWLPPLAHPVSPVGNNFFNMVPRFRAAHDEHVTLQSNRLFNYTFSPTGNTTIEFFYRLTGTVNGTAIPPDLLVARLDVLPGTIVPGADLRAVSPDWFRRVRPFSFGVHGITRQRGGVSILNNVINSDRRERVFLDFRTLRAGRVTVQVFTLDGTLVRILHQGNKPASGERFHRVSWDGTNNAGRPVARGMYFIRVVAPDIDEIRKVMVVR